MPCYIDPPTHADREALRLDGFLDEIGDDTPKSSGFFFGKIRRLSLNEMTQRLCAWSRAHDPSTRSLEFQIWWRDHQAQDRRHELEAEAGAGSRTEDLT